MFDIFTAWQRHRAMARIQIYLTEGQPQAPREAAERQGLSVSELIRQTLDRPSPP
jgi:16S rRNA U516 pseudouridylate synthase RsuA-like enzyme